MGKAELDALLLDGGDQWRRGELKGCKADRLRKLRLARRWSGARGPWRQVGDGATVVEAECAMVGEKEGSGGLWTDSEQGAITVEVAGSVRWRFSASRAPGRGRGDLSVTGGDRGEQRRPRRCHLEQGAQHLGASTRRGSLAAHGIVEEELMVVVEVDIAGWQSEAAAALRLRSRWSSCAVCGAAW